MFRTSITKLRIIFVRKQTYNNANSIAPFFTNNANGNVLVIVGNVCKQFTHNNTNTICDCNHTTVRLLNAQFFNASKQRCAHAKYKAWTHSTNSRNNHCSSRISRETFNLQNCSKQVLASALLAQRKDISQEYKVTSETICTDICSHLLWAIDGIKYF